MPFVPSCAPLLAPLSRSAFLGPPCGPRHLALRLSAAALERTRRCRRRTTSAPFHYHFPASTPPTATAAAAATAPTFPLPPPSPPPPAALDVVRLARPEARYLLLALAASLVSSAVMLLTPIAFGRVLDIVSSFHRVAPAEGLAHLSRAAQRLMFIYLIGAACRLFEVALIRIAGERIVAGLRSRVFSKIIRSDVAVLEKSSTGEFMSRLSNDTAVLQRCFTDDVVKLLQGALEAVVGCVMLATLSPKLAIVVYLTVPLTTAAGVFYGNRTAHLAKAVSSAFADASQVANEQLSGIRIVKSFAREGYAESLYNDKVGNALTIGKTAAWADGTLQMWNRLVFQLTTCAVLLMGGRLVAAGSLSVGAMMAFVLYTSHLTNALGKFSSGIGEFIRASGAIDRVVRIMRSTSSIEGERVRKPKVSRDYAVIGYGVDFHAEEIPNGAVQFRNVSFKYPCTERQVLRNISFSVSAGGSVALVGGSGAGKSTTLALLSRFYDPTSGVIRLDNQDLSQYNLQDLRESIVGIVSQDPYIISGTLANNIAFGRPDATRSEIEEAAKAAGVTQFSHRMAQGLDTPASRLSGGEKQRLMIARCLVKKPVIMILDEPTSALDRRSEALVNETIEGLIEDKRLTVLLISHRLSTVKYCEKVLVFEDGEVVEQGRYEELLQNDGAFAKLLQGVR